MNLYFDITDLCDVNDLMDRVDSDNYRYSPKVQQTIYMFVACYSAHVLRSVIKSGLGDGFVTYTAPNVLLVMEDMCSMWSREDIIDMKICFDTLDFQSVVRFSNIHHVLDHALARYGTSIAAIRDTSYVHVDCSSMGKSLIRLECK